MAILRIFIVPLAHLGLLPQYAGKVTSASVDKALACIDGNILAPRFSHVSLPGPADFLHRIRNHFAPLGNPAGCPGQRKQNREHRGCARLRRYPSGRTGRRYLWKPPRGGVFFVRLMSVYGLLLVLQATRLMAVRYDCIRISGLFSWHALMPGHNGLFARLLPIAIPDSRPVDIPGFD